MAGMVRNFVARVSVSAVIGALVAGGLVWFSQESQSRGAVTQLSEDARVQADQVTGLDAKLDTLLAANAEQADRIAALQSQIEALVAVNDTLRDEVSTQSSSVAALEYERLQNSGASAESFTTVNAAIEALSADLADLKSMMTQHQPQDMPDFDTIIDKMLSAVQRLDDMTRTEGGN